MYNISQTCIKTVESPENRANSEVKSHVMINSNISQKTTRRAAKQFKNKNL